MDEKLYIAPPSGDRENTVSPPSPQEFYDGSVRGANMNLSWQGHANMMERIGAQSRDAAVEMDGLSLTERD